MCSIIHRRGQEKNKEQNTNGLTKEDGTEKEVEKEEAVMVFYWLG